MRLLEQDALLGGRCVVAFLFCTHLTTETIHTHNKEFIHLTCKYSEWIPEQANTDMYVSFIDLSLPRFAQERPQGQQNVWWGLGAHSSGSDRLLSFCSDSWNICVAIYLALCGRTLAEEEFRRFPTFKLSRHQPYRSFPLYKSKRRILPAPRQNRARLSTQCHTLTMAGAVQEGPEYGIGDFILLEHVDMPSFMKNLKKR